jgi:hypothetical protein
MIMGVVMAVIVAMIVAMIVVVGCWDLTRLHSVLYRRRSPESAAIGSLGLGHAVVDMERRD